MLLLTDRWVSRSVGRRHQGAIVSRSGPLVRLFIVGGARRRGDEGPASTGITESENIRWGGRGWLKCLAVWGRGRLREQVRIRDVCETVSICRHAIPAHVVILRRKLLRWLLDRCSWQGRCARGWTLSRSRRWHC